MNNPSTLSWPNQKRIAVCFNVCLEAWSDGKAPGISPMGNPLPPGVLDNTAISWAAYGPRRGIYRLLDGFARHGARASVMTNAIIAERHPEAVKAVVAGGHELVSHSYAMDVMPVMMKEDEERTNIRRCTELLQNVSGKAVKGWLSPRATPSANSARLLTEAGYVWYGDTLADDLPWTETFGDKKIVAIPLSTDVNDMRSMKDSAPVSAIVSTFEEQLTRLREHDSETAVIDCTVHAHIFGRPHGAHYFERVVEMAARSPDVWVATRMDIANAVLAGEQ
jgi:peptidoglycan/xylan/chitin deacetylase (PgdA/CDA1 family)